jgi:hypothetical protein
MIFDAILRRPPRFPKVMATVAHSMGDATEIIAYRWRT